MMNIGQSFINWKIPAYQTFDQFCVGENKELFDLLKSVSNNSLGLLYFWGQSFSGKTHLLNSCFDQVRKMKKKAYFLAMGSMKNLEPDVLDQLNDFDVLIIDDVDQVISKDWELSFFNLINHTDFNHQTVIFSAKHSPKAIDLHFNDLKTRLAQGLVHQIHLPIYSDRIVILKRWFQEEQFDIQARSLNYLINRFGGSMPILFKVVNYLKSESMQHQKKITIQLIGKLLKKNFDQFGV